MDSMAHVRSIATRVRNWAEEYQATYQTVSSDLNGLCAIASVKLYNALKDAGFKPELCMAEYLATHCFVVVNDHVVDVTATQFRQFQNTPVVVLHTKMSMQYDFYNVDIVFKTIKDLCKHQVRHSWPEEQRVTSAFKEYA